MVKTINFKKVFLWLFIISSINFGLFLLIHKTIEKNHLSFIKKDIELTHHIIDYFNKNDVTNIAYNLKLQSHLLKTNPLYAKLMLFGVNLDNFNDGKILINRDIYYRDLPYENFSLSFTNIPKNTCAVFAKEFLNLADKVTINETNINTLNEFSTLSVERLNTYCHSTTNLIIFNFKIKNKE